MQTIPERLRELADEIERKQTPPQPFADQADEALYLQTHTLEGDRDETTLDRHA